MKKNFLKRAFTLLELLVVIGIIGILVALGAASYSTAQKKARDARRQSDLNAVQKVMEQCYSINSYVYPSITGSPGTLSITCNSITTTFTDPLNTGTYRYTASVTSTSAYTVTADLETSTTDARVDQQQ